MGFLDNAEVRKLIVDAKALILPTQLYEGVSMSIVEAFSVGTPVLCSDFGNCGSIVQDGLSGYKFQKDSVPSIISAVKKLSDCGGIRRTTFADYKAHFGEDTNYTILMHIYDAVQSG